MDRDEAMKQWVKRAITRAVKDKLTDSYDLVSYELDYGDDFTVSYDPSWDDHYDLSQLVEARVDKLLPALTAVLDID